MREEARTQPSPRAVERFEAGLDAELGTLRARLHRALAEADEHQAAGRDDLAAAALEAERATLVEVHRRLQGQLAAASVEREAEAVVAAAASETGRSDTDGDVNVRAETVGALPAAPDLGTQPPPPSPPVESPVVRLVASAVAAVVGIVLLAGPDLVADGLTAAGTGTGASDVSEPTPDDRSPTAESDDVGPGDTADAVPTSSDAQDTGGSHTPSTHPALRGDTTRGGRDRSVSVPAPGDHDEGPLDLPLPRVDLVERLGLDGSTPDPDDGDAALTERLEARTREEPPGPDGR